MSRYGLFGATDANNKYVKFMSDGLSQFIESSGATNFGFTVDEITRTATGFTPLPGYVEQPGNQKPVTVRYIPMHLYKRGGAFASMKPIYVLSVNGDEDSRRAARYHWTVMMDREDLLNPPKGTYLDRIFGIPLMTSGQIKKIREGTVKVDWSLPPEKIPTVLTKKSEDRRAVYGAVDALYREKYVFIKLESGQTFRHRAFEILGEIYSMLQPEFAVEVGFSSYQAADGIDSLISDAGVRIFVFPHEIDETKLHRDDAVLIDLDHTENIAKPENEELLRCLEKWAGLEWEDRCDAMQKLFARPGIDFKSAETFVRISSEFFDNDFVQWQKLGRNVPQAGKITSLAELKNLYDSFAVLKTYGTNCNKTQFRKMLKYLLPQGANLNAWVRDAETAAATADSEAETKQLTALAEFGEQFVSVDILRMLVRAVAKAVRKITKERTEKEKEAEFAQEREQHRKEIEAKNLEIEAKNCEIKATITKCEEAQRATEKACEEKQKATEKACEEAQRATEKACEEKQKATEKACEEKQKATETECKKKLDDQKNKFDTEKKSLQKEFEAQKKSYTDEIESLKNGTKLKQAEKQLREEKKNADKAKILFGVIGLAVGAAVCFGVFAMLGKLKTPEPEIVYVTPAPTVEPTATPETTPLPTAEPTPTPAALLTEDGQVNEEYVAENAPDVKVITDSAQIEALYAVPLGYESVALLTAEDIESETDEAAEAAPETGASEAAAETEPSEEAAAAEAAAGTETAAEASEETEKKLTDYAVLLRSTGSAEVEVNTGTAADACIAAEIGEYRMVIFGSTEFQETILKLCSSLLTENETPKLLAVLADGNTVDLTEPLKEYFAQEETDGAWYQKLRYVAVAAEDISAWTASSDTEPTAAVAVFDDGEVKICGTAGTYHAVSETPAESSEPAESETDNA